MINRREALVRMGSLMATGWLGARTALGAEETSGTDSADSATSATNLNARNDSPRGKPFSIAHITDVHVFDELHAQKWFATCLHHIQSNPANPSLIINTGDSVMETLKADRARAELLWKIWREVLGSENSLPIHHCIGNHDVWGLGLTPDHPEKSDPRIGKDLALENLHMPRSYYSFDYGDWHFIVLDSIFPTGPEEKRGWTGRLDDEQFHWLKADLEATPADTPVAVFSHIPILTVTAMIFQKPGEGDTGYRLPPYDVLGDARRVIDLFAKHPNVKLCMSGHMHLQDRIELAGVTYICDGSVSGQWWRGDRINCPPGYSLVTLKPDGSFDYNYTTYGWKPDPAAQTN